MTVVRVVLADRSPAVRAVLRRLLTSDARISVEGETADGRELLELTQKLRPNGVILDLDLPNLGGRALAEAIWEASRVPIFALAPRQHSETTREAFGAHHLGVIAVFPKPDVPEEWGELGRTLGEAVLNVASEKNATQEIGHEPDDTPVIGRDLRFIAVGASTGGPGAISELLQAIGPDTSLGVAVVQHISSGFEEALVDWLATELGADVAVARDGDALLPGFVRLAPAGGHLRLDRGGILRVDRATGPVNGHCPAVDVLFQSLVQHASGEVAAVLLSGMGSDGVDGLAELYSRDVLTIAQDRASCALFGMPRAAIERKVVSLSLPPAQIGRLLSRSGRR